MEHSAKFLHYGLGKSYTLFTKANKNDNTSMRNIIWCLYFIYKFILPILPPKIADAKQNPNDIRKTVIWFSKMGNNMKKIFNYEPKNTNWWNEFTISKINILVCVYIDIYIYVFIECYLEYQKYSYLLININNNILAKSIYI